MSAKLQVVWFKRDLRVDDHKPLLLAAKRGPVLPLYIADPVIYFAPDFAPCHWTFIRSSLIELRRRFFALGQPLVVRTGDSLAVLEAIHASHQIGKIWAHEEHGNAASRECDRQIREWAGQRRIKFAELPSNGVIRGRDPQTDVDDAWERYVRKPAVATLTHLTPVHGIEPGPIPDHHDLGISPDSRGDPQRGGETLGGQALSAFLTMHGEHYARDETDLVTQWEASSRISPYLSWGNLSVRQAVRATRSQMHQVRAAPETERDDWPRSLALFESRLRWRSRSIQEFEDDARIEQSNIVRAYDVLDWGDVDQQRMGAWEQGQTGYPLIDACMRALGATGWLSYRMRTMIVSFAAFDLWLPWQASGMLLARAFLDYDPGIHWLQMQYHAGRAQTGTPRIYNPTKQAQELDPNGAFIKRWLPELANVPVTFIHTPWLMPATMQRSSGCVIGVDYPEPIVDHLVAAREAQRRMIDAQALCSASTEPLSSSAGRTKAANRSSTRKRKKQREESTQLSFPLE